MNDATTALLRLVRPSVATVRVDQRDALWIPAISGSCTNVAKLIATFDANALVQLKLLTESFESGLWPKLKHVSLKFSEVSSETIQCITTLLRALTDKTHAMAKQLEVLKVESHFVANRQRIVDADLHGVALRMLQSNTHLANVKIELPIRTTNVERVVDMEREFAKLHNTPLHVPQGLREKAAFLSVLWGNDHVGWRLPLTRELGADVITKVFKLAAPACRRLISIQMPHP